MTAVDPEGRIRHPLDVFHSTFAPDGSNIPAGMVPVADGLGQVDYVSSSGLGSGDIYDMVVDGGLFGDGVTDNAALIEAAWDDGTDSGTRSRAFYWPPGDYRITRALQDTGAWNAQVRLPSVATSANQITIHNFGPVRPPLEWIGPSGPDPAGYAIIRSTLTGASGTASCISGGDNGSGLAHINNIRPTFENLIFIGPDNPSFTMLNLAQCQGCEITGVQLSPIAAYAGTFTQPTHSNAYGVKMPAREMSDYSGTDGLSSAGWYTCIQLGEIDVHRGLILGNCIVAMEAPAVYYPTVIESVTAVSYQYGIRATGYHPITIHQYTAEHYSAVDWRNTIYDIDDASNYLVGPIQWYTAATGGSADHSFVLNGGAGLWTHETIKLAPVSGVTASTYGSATAVPIVAVDVYGRITSATTATITAGIGEILVSDTPSTPLIFADLIQNEAQDDLVYADP